MKLTLEREILAKKLQSSVAAIGSSMIPILNEVLFQAKKDRLFITSSNGEVQLTISMKCEIEGDPEDFVCDARLFLTPVTTLKSKEIFMGLSSDTVTLFTKRSKNKYEAPLTYKAENYPILNSEEWSEPFEIKGEVFSKMIKKSSMFVDKNNIRPGMQGISMSSNGTVFTMQSVDVSGQIICHLEAMPPEESDFKELQQTLLPKAVESVVQQFEKSASVRICTEEQGRQLRIDDKMSIVILRLLEGKFPDCSPLIEMYEPSVNVKVLTEDIALSMKRAGGFSDENSLTKLDFSSEESVLIECENNAFKKKAQENIPVQHKSKEIDFASGINFKYMTKTLLTMSGENTFLSQLAPNKNLHISDDANEGFNTLWIIAPMILPKTVED